MRDLPTTSLSKEEIVLHVSHPSKSHHSTSRRHSAEIGSKQQFDKLAKISNKAKSTERHLRFFESDFFFFLNVELPHASLNRSPLKWEPGKRKKKGKKQPLLAVPCECNEKEKPFIGVKSCDSLAGEEDEHC